MERKIKLVLRCGLLIWILIGWTGSLQASRHEGLAQDQLQLLREVTEAATGQISPAITHTLFAWSALSRGDAAAAETHAHHAINIIEGPEGEHYDASYGGPKEGIGDGVGAWVHAQRLFALLEQTPQGSNYLIAGENVLLFLEAAISHELGALEQMKSDPAAAMGELRQAQGLLMAARGSQEEKDRPTEGGTRTILAWLSEAP